MDNHKPKHGTGRKIFILIGIVSVLSISATFVLAGGTVFLPLVAAQNPTPSQTAGITPTVPITPTVTITPTPEGTPQPPTIQLIVTPSNADKDWALAFFAKSYNGAGRPVMEIYPGDTSPDSERIKIPEGTVVLALDTPVIADGGAKYWQLTEYKGNDGEDLFLKAVDVTKMSLTEPGS